MAYKQAGPQIQRVLAELLDYVRDAEEAAYKETRRGRNDDYDPRATPNHIYHRIVLLSRWLEGTVDRDGTPR
jgi:hypothetical protein